MAYKKVMPIWMACLVTSHVCTGYRTTNPCLVGRINFTLEVGKNQPKMRGVAKHDILFGRIIKEKGRRDSRRSVGPQGDGEMG